MLAQLARSSGSKTATKEIATGTVPDVWSAHKPPGKYKKGLGGEGVRKGRINYPGSIGPVD